MFFWCWEKSYAEFAEKGRRVRDGNLSREVSGEAEKLLMNIGKSLVRGMYLELSSSTHRQNCTCYVGRFRR